MSRYWPTFNSTRSSFHICQPRAPRPASSMSAYTNERSPIKMAAPSPKRRASPAHDRARCCACMLSCVVVAPRRVIEPSMMSSWNKANACSNSNAAPASTTRGSSGLPPAPTKPQCVKTGRKRLPPPTTMRSSSSNTTARSRSKAAQRPRSAERNAVSRASTRAAISRRAAGALLTRRGYASK